MQKELVIAQEKLRAIDSLTNSSQKLAPEQKDKISYLIHQIIEADYFNSDLARQVMSISLDANKDLFINVNI
jgi:hypothetical protein